MRVFPIILFRQRGVHEARGYAVDLYIVRGPFNRHGLGSLCQGRFRHAVNRQIGKAKRGSHRPDMDDLATALLSHHGMHGLAQEEGAAEIDAANPVKVLLRHSIDQLPPAGSGTVQKNVDAAQCGVQN